MKDKKNILGVGIILLLLVCLGVTYAWFQAKIENMNSNVSVVTTGKLRLEYTDGEEILFNNMIPGNSISKTFTVKNTGTEEVIYDLFLESIENTVLNNELVISATCTRLNSDGVEDGTCDDIKQVSVSKSNLKRKISIEPNITHKYNVTLTFIDTGSKQNYNMDATYTGKLGVKESTGKIVEPIYCTFNGDLTQGTEYVNGQYTYRYMQESNGSWDSDSNKMVFSWENINEDGWGVALTDKSSTNPVTSDVCTYVNDKPVVSMANMFLESQTTTIDLSNFDTSNVTNMGGMFTGSKVLTLDLSSFDTGNVKYMDYMFDGSQATSINLNDFDTSNVISMSFMFRNTQTTSLDVSSFNTNNVENMFSMFSGSKITSLDISNFNTSNVTDMGGMFESINVSSLDLSNFDTSKVIYMDAMFADCTLLKTIYVGNKFIIGDLESSDSMFEGSTSLVGGNGTVYDSSYVDKTYARIDTASTPGYFTSKGN